MIGEYVALSGGPALVCAIEPRFEFGAPSEELGPAARFHPDSPAGRLAGEINFVPFAFKDPYEGRGGFGASTAQFIAAWRAAGNPLSETEVVWRAYRARAGQPRPSGADLVAQLTGEAVWVGFRDDGMALTVEAESSGLLARMRVYSATRIEGRKTATHEHLRSLGAEGVIAPALRATLRAILSGARDALSREDGVALGRAMDDYAEALHAAGLEHAEAQRDRLALRKLPGVLGVKGTGARLSDAVLVLMAADRAADADVERLDEEARGRGLEPLGWLSSAV